MPADPSGSQLGPSEAPAGAGPPVAEWHETLQAGSVPTRPELPPAMGRPAALSVAARWAVHGWRAAIGLLLFAGLFFLLLGTPAWVDDRFPGSRPAFGTLDGAAYMTTGRYNWPDDQHTIELSYDYQAIHWLLDHVQGTPVVAEAPAGGYDVGGQPVGYDYYRAGGLRVASLTGLPTFVGQHENEQRSGLAVAEQTSLGQEFFSTEDLERTRALITQLHVGYIYVGQLERILFSDAALGKFEALVATGDLQLAYRNPQVVIYRVP